MIQARASNMKINAYNEAENWEREIVRINGSVDELKAKFEAECQALHSTVSTQIEEVRRSLRRLENKIAGASADAHIQKIAAQIEELKLKGFQAVVPAYRIHCLAAVATSTDD